MPKSVYDIIKKQNGEKFAQVLRSFNLLLIPDIANKLKYAGRDPDMELIRYLLKITSLQNSYNESGIGKNPFQLLHSAGYEYVEYADSLEKQNKISKYFRKNEQLCTFKEPRRYKNFYIINAVKYNAENIMPRKRPQRQDEYGTSVISIQISKEYNFISIKNRYNDSVTDPDNTFDSNPDNIIMGLSGALRSYFNISWDSFAALPINYISIGDDIIKYNYTINDRHIGPWYYEYNNKITEINRYSQVMMDYFILDIENRDVIDFADSNENSVIDTIKNEIIGKTLAISGKFPNQTIYADGVAIIKLNDGEIVYLNLPTTEHIGDNFLRHNKSLIEFHAPRLKTVGDDFLYKNEILEHFDAPEIETVGEHFIRQNKSLTAIDLGKLKSAGESFLKSCSQITKISLPNLESAEQFFMSNTKALREANLPKLKTLPPYAFFDCRKLSRLNIPMAELIKNFALSYNEYLLKLDIPNVECIDNHVLRFNNKLMYINAPKLSFVGEYSFEKVLPSVKYNTPKLANAEKIFTANESMFTRGLKKLKEKLRSRRIAVNRQNNSHD